MYVRVLIYTVHEQLNAHDLSLKAVAKADTFSHISTHFHKLFRGWGVFKYIFKQLRRVNRGDLLLRRSEHTAKRWLLECIMGADRIILVFT